MSVVGLRAAESASGASGEARKLGGRGEARRAGTEVQARVSTRDGANVPAAEVLAEGSGAVEPGERASE